MAAFLLIFPYLRIALFALILLVTLIYSIPIICVRRFHHRNNILTLNICIATFLSSLYWLAISLIFQLDFAAQISLLMEYCRLAAVLPVALTLQVPLSFATASLNRLCAVVYHHRSAFKTKFWITTNITAQWILGGLLSLPLLAGYGPVCTNVPWHQEYMLLIIVVLPALFFLIINIIIFAKVRSSTRRIQAAPSSSANNIFRNGMNRFNRRDLRLLRHMVVMIVVYIVGWGPFFLASCLQTGPPSDSPLYAGLAVWSEISLLCDIIDLFLYNHEVRTYLKKLFCRC